MTSFFAGYLVGVIFVVVVVGIAAAFWIKDFMRWW